MPNCTKWNDFLRRPKKQKNKNKKHKTKEIEKLMKTENRRTNKQKTKTE